MSDIHVARLRGMGPASWTRTPWTSRRRRTGAICESWCGWSIAMTAKAAECTRRGLAFSWLPLWRLKLVVCTNCHDRLPASLGSFKLAFKECLVSAVASSVWRVLWLVFILVKLRAVCCCENFPRAPLAAMDGLSTLASPYFLFFCLLKRKRSYRRTDILKSRTKCFLRRPMGSFLPRMSRPQLLFLFSSGCIFLSRDRACIPGAVSGEKRGPQFHAVTRSSRRTKEREREEWSISSTLEFARVFACSLAMLLGV